MSIVADITIMVDRLKRANIPSEHLCYMLDEHDWLRFTQEIEEMHVGYEQGNRDYSYIKEMRFVGMHVRQYTSKPGA